jgi:hypothetical protein
MAHAIRNAWKANRYWVAAGFLASTSLFLVLIFVTLRDERRAIEQSKATGLSAITTWDLRSQWAGRSILPVSFSKQRPRSVDFARGMTGGVVGGVASLALSPRASSAADVADRQVVRSGALEIIAADPLLATNQLRNLATRFSGFVVSSKISGSDARMQSAQVIVRIPAAHFDEARVQVRAVAKSVELDAVEARDVTREYVDQEAVLRNARAEEQQYLVILKRAASVQDVLEVTSKLAELRGHIDELQTALNSLHNEVEMSVLTVNVTAMADAQVFGIRWRPFYKAKLSLRDAISAIADYGDSTMALVLNLPVIVLWGFTIVALIKVGWLALRRIVLLFFPALPTWLHRSAQANLGPSLSASP